MVLEAGYPGTTGFSKVVKVSVFVKKKPGLSEAEFIDHYNNKHAQMAAPVLLKHNIINYSLTYHLKRDRQMMQDILKGNAHLLEYDAICQFYFRNYKDFATFLYDPLSKALTGDHDNFMVESEMKMMVGDEYIVIQDGQKIG